MKGLTPLLVDLYLECLYIAYFGNLFYLLLRKLDFQLPLLCFICLKLEPFCLFCEGCFFVCFFWPFCWYSVTQSRPILCNPMNCFHVLHHLPELAQIHVHWVTDAIQPSHPLSSPSPPAFYLSQHQALFKWVSSSHQVAKVLELQLQPQSFQWIFRTDFL